MSLMERRLQLLLDQDRYDRIAAVAQQENKSVASVIRYAIDFAYPSQDVERRVAIQKLLDSVEANPDTGPPEEWADMKKAMEDELFERLDRWS